MATFPQHLEKIIEAVREQKAKEEAERRAREEAEHRQIVERGRAVAEEWLRLVLTDVPEWLRQYARMPGDNDQDVYVWMANDWRPDEVYFEVPGCLPIAFDVRRKMYRPGRVNGEPRFYSPDDYREPGWEFSSLVATPEEALEIAEAEYRCFSEQRAWLEEKKRNWQPRPPRDEICPVMSVAEGGFYMCVRERCAWWVTWRGVNACAVTVQAMAMMKSSGLSGED